ncbi:hypothetical protein PENSPDRAFT_687666 [Peniophora sp. CONT]|nr:hypothetical protein PENSPDRAFT_687666 [Peniophora sp. CONT]
MMTPSPAPKEVANDARSFWTNTARLRLDGIKTSAHSRRRREETLKLEIEALRETVSSATKLYNTQTGIGSLPPETLSHIFAYVKAFWLPTSTHYWNKHAYGPQGCELIDDSLPPSSVTIYRSGWMSLLHVCSYWREIITNNATMWASHANCLEINLGWLPDIVYRAKTLPLDLTFNKRIERVKESVESADGPLFGWLDPRSVCPRLKRLSFVDCVSGFWSEPFGEVNLQLNLLEDLHIDLTGINAEDDYSYANNLLTKVLKGWSNDMAPRLQKLTLRGCSFVPWDSVILSAGLTSLHIESGVPAENMPKYREIAKVLRAYTSLESLTLVTAIPIAVPNPPRIVLASTMRYLKLALFGRIDHCVKFLHQLAIHKNCTVCVELNLRDYREDTRATIRGPVQRAFAYLYGFDPPQELVFGDHMYYTMYRTLQPREAWGRYARRYNCHYVLNSNSNVALLDVRASSRDWHVLDGEYAPDLSSLRALSFTRSGLTAATMYARDHEPVWPLFASAVNVKRIGIPFDEDPLPLLEALAELSTESTPSFRLCPTLDTLVLTVDDSHRAKGNVPADGRISSTLELKNLVKMRKERGVPLREFVVDEVLRECAVWESLRTDATVTFFNPSAARS